MNVNKWNYGNYSSNNYGFHTMGFTVNNVDYYFSYNTLVAFRANGRLVVRQNDWAQTTGKHLNWIDGGDKKNRVNSAEFSRLLQELTGQSE